MKPFFKIGEKLRDLSGRSVMVTEIYQTENGFIYQCFVFGVNILQDYEGQYLLRKWEPKINE